MTYGYLNVLDLSSLRRLSTDDASHALQGTVSNYRVCHRQSTLRVWPSLSVILLLILGYHSGIYDAANTRIKPPEGSDRVCLPREFQSILWKLDLSVGPSVFHSGSLARSDRFHSGTRPENSLAPEET
jgi:hypothetical protein